MKQADIAMYQAKKSGRNTLCFFDPQMQDIVNARTALESELRNRIEKKSSNCISRFRLTAQTMYWEPRR